MVDVIKPPVITMANGRSISVPCMRRTKIGSKPRIAVAAVMIFGRTLPMLASRTASSKGLPRSVRDRVCVTNNDFESERHRCLSER